MCGADGQRLNERLCREGARSFAKTDGVLWGGAAVMCREERHCGRVLLYMHCCCYLWVLWL